MSSSRIIKAPRFMPGTVLIRPPLIVTSSPRSQVRLEDGVEGEAGGEGAAAGQPAAAPPGFVPESAEIIHNARLQAEAILREAAIRAEETRTKAYDKGYQKGRSDGLASAKAEVLKDARVIGEMARNAVVEMEAIFTSSEEALLELALSIAEKVLNKRLQEDRVLVASIVSGALAQIDASKVVRVRVNPADIEALRPYWEQEHMGAGGRMIELTADMQVQEGGCVIDAINAVIDAQIDTQLAEIEKALRAEMGSEAGS